MLNQISDDSKNTESEGNTVLGALSTKSSSRKNFERTLTVEEDSEDLNSPESLKELILHISGEYDEIKEKYNSLMNTVYEKEKIIQDLLECLNSKDEEHKTEIDEKNKQIEDLNDKIQSYEIEVYSKNLKDEYTRIARKSVYFKKNEEDYEEDNYLRVELSKKEIEIQNLRIKFEEKLKDNEIKYQNYISDLQSDLRKFQETLNSKNEYGDILKSQICEIDESREMLERKNLSLTKEIQHIENLRKEERFFHDNELQKLKEEISALKSILDEKNEELKLFENQNNKNIQKIKELTELKVVIAEKEQVIEKLQNNLKSLQKDVEIKENEKKNLLAEYQELKNEFTNMGNHFKEVSVRLSEENRVEKIRLSKGFDNEKKEFFNEMEKMKQIIDSLNSTISTYKINLENRSSVRGENLENLENFENLGNLKDEKNEKTLPKNIYVPPINFPKSKSGIAQNVSFLLDSPEMSINRRRTELDDVEEGNFLTLRDCLSDEEDEEEEDLRENEKDKKIKELNSKIEEKEKVTKDLVNKIEEMKNSLENIMTQNLELKSLLANERFEKENQVTMNRMKMKKLKEYIQKQELVLALKSLSSIN